MRNCLNDVRVVVIAGWLSYRQAGSAVISAAAEKLESFYKRKRHISRCFRKHRQASKWQSALMFSYFSYCQQNFIFLKQNLILSFWGQNRRSSHRILNATNLFILSRFWCSSSSSVRCVSMRRILGTTLWTVKGCLFCTFYWTSQINLRLINPHTHFSGESNTKLLKKLKNLDCNLQFFPHVRSRNIYTGLGLSHAPMVGFSTIFLNHCTSPRRSFQTVSGRHVIVSLKTRLIIGHKRGIS